MLEQGSRALALAAVATCAFATTAAAQSPDGWFAGKTVRLVIGTATGGSFDAYSRILAPHLRKYLPGSPTLVAENMPGASGVRSANWLAQIAPKDGTAIAIFNQNLTQRQLLEPDQVKFDLRTFSWIGAMAKSANVTYTWHETGVRSLEDARKREVVIGALSIDSGNAIYPLLFNKFLGTRFKVVTGYPGGNTIQIAMERREVDGQGVFPWPGLKSGWPQWIAERKIHLLLQVGLVKEPDLPDVPLLLDLARTPSEKALFNFLSAHTAILAPVSAPPGLPPARLADLRKAFQQAVSDPDLLADVAKRKLDLDPTTGEKTQQIVTSIIETPADVIAAIKTALADARSQVVDKAR